MLPVFRVFSGASREGMALGSALAAIGLIVWVYTSSGVTDETIAALSFLLVVVAAAVRATLRVALIAALVATACFNFFFLPPTGTWAIADPENWFAFATLLVVSVVVSRLSAQVRARERDAVTRRDELARLFDLTRDILMTTSPDDPTAEIARHVARRFRVAAASIYRKSAGSWEEHCATAPLGVPAATLDATVDRAAAVLEFDAGSRAYLGASVVTRGEGPDLWLVPLRLGSSTVGVLAVRATDLDAGTRDAIAGIVAIAIERQHLLDARRAADLARRGAELRSELLASLSHDLRTPLTAVVLAASNLDTADLPEAQHHEQIEIIRREGVRLSRLVENVLDMARIETKAVTPEAEWVPLLDIVDAARRQVGSVMDGHQVIADVDERTLVHLDPRLTAAALAHVVENAAQYSPPGSSIEIGATAGADDLTITVRDHGPGVPGPEIGRVFDRAYRGREGQQRFGTGMGLAITRGLIAAQGGRVSVENQPDGGACFTLVVPAGIRAASLDATGEEAE